MQGKSITVMLELLYCINIYTHVCFFSDAEVSIEDVKGGFHLAKDTIMQCVTDNPNTSLTWSKEGKDLAKGKNDLNGDGVDDVEVNNQNQIVLLSADPVLAGEYTCTADLGSTTKPVSQTIAGNVYISQNT